MKQDVVVAAAQMGPSEAGPEQASLRVASMIAEAAAAGAILVCFPELSLSSYFPARPRGAQRGDEALSFGDGVIRRVQDAVRAAQIWAVVPFAERNERVVYNSAVLINPVGDVEAVYRKAHLPAGFGLPGGGVSTYESMYFAKGSRPCVVASIGSHLKVGLLICYDRFFPESAKLAALEGADVLCVPSNNRAYGAEWATEAWELLVRARAYENGVYVVAPDKAGTEFGDRFLGDSVIASPVGGQVLARAKSDADEVIVAKVSSEDLQMIRSRSDVARDRRPELYQGLAK